jgi:hypothetical protein
VSSRPLTSPQGIAPPSPISPPLWPRASLHCYRNPGLQLHYQLRHVRRSLNLQHCCLPLSLEDHLVFSASPERLRTPKFLTAPLWVFHPQKIALQKLTTI